MCFSELRHMLAFLTMVVYKGWFKEIHLNFLRPGHTHTDIDQLFSVFHGLDKFHDCDTPKEFIDKWLRIAYKTKRTRPRAKFITWIYDWKRWFARCMYTQISGHSKIGAFLFKKNRKGQFCFAPLFFLKIF